MQRNTQIFLEWSFLLINLEGQHTSCGRLSMVCDPETRLDEAIGLTQQTLSLPNALSLLRYYKDPLGILRRGMWEGREDEWPRWLVSLFLGRLARFLKRQEKPVSGWCCTPVSFMPSWSTVWVPGQPGLQEPLVEHLFLKIALIWGAKILAWYQLGISAFSYPFVAVRKIVSPITKWVLIFFREKKRRKEGFLGFFCLFLFSQ